MGAVSRGVSRRQAAEAHKVELERRRERGRKQKPKPDDPHAPECARVQSGFRSPCDCRSP